MCRIKVSVSLELVLFSIFLVASIAFTPPLHAQAAVDTTIAVRMIDAVNSASDPAGKQYRASVTKTVDAANGVVITQGSAAVVTLANSGSGWSARLSSVSINGQPIAVASSSASVTSTAQNAAVNAMHAMNSVLGGLGHHVKIPTAVSAVAAGPRVVLPPGTTLTFVLSQPPGLTSAAAPPAPASQPAAVSVQSAASPASGLAGASAGGSVTAMYICFSNPPVVVSDPTHNTEYLTAVFEVPIDVLRASKGIEPKFADYLKATYHARPQVTCQPIWSVADAQTAQKQIASDHSSKMKLVDTGWRYGQPPLVRGQSGFDPRVLGPGGLDLSQHRLTTYFCSLTASGGTTMAQTDPVLANQVTYVSPVFQADWDSGPVNRAFDVYIRDHYVHDLDLSNKSPRCLTGSPAALPPTMQKDAIRTTSTGHAVAVDFTDTPAQAAAGNAAATQVAAAAAAAQKLGPREGYVVCYSDPSAPVMYFSEVFVGEGDPPSGPRHEMSHQNLGSKYLAFLRQKYSFKSSALCIGGSSEAAPAQRLKQGMEDQFKKSNKQIVETGWKGE